MKQCRRKLTDAERRRKYQAALLDRSGTLRITQSQNVQKTIDAYARKLFSIAADSKVPLGLWQQAYSEAISIGLLAHEPRTRVDNRSEALRQALRGAPSHHAWHLAIYRDRWPRHERDFNAGLLTAKALRLLRASEPDGYEAPLRIADERA